MTLPTPPRHGTRTPLDRFNSAALATVEPLLLRCCGSRRWARRLVAHRPYPDVEALLAAADEASYDLTPADLREALVCESAAHPLEGEPQPGVLAAHTALRAAHGAYERKFGHAFLYCLDGFAAEERLDQVLAGIRLRLENDADEEWAVTAEELRRLARGRLGRLAAPGPAD
ncbi:2-oxo-4-hydroxy-4-carboxy-5-ureidoimidazoline decarboxylase [Streptomyces sp. NPDC006925]|uniref:2-oxo-4-hydroxy-4-carboxy-5-ureidoimidazoline decarboxylase n=1 Tax=Streptomyces sp. NPDC006925 TaxID=3364768 RepID=UPI003699B7B0